MWAADGRTIVYSSIRGESFDLYQRSIDLSEPESLLLDPENNLRSQAWSADGALVVRDEIPGKGMDVWVWPSVGDESSIRTLLTGPEDELASAISRDGRWLAYVSDQSGRDEVYVTIFPQAGGRVQVSASGATSPAWSPDGKERYYMEGDGLVAVQVATAPSFRVLRREPMFSGSYLQYRRHRQYDVHPDGAHFLMIQNPPAGDVEIVLNWFTELERLTAEVRCFGIGWPESRLLRDRFRRITAGTGPWRRTTPGEEFSSR